MQPKIKLPTSGPLMIGGINQWIRTTIVKTLLVPSTAYRLTFKYRQLRQNIWNFSLNRASHRTQSCKKSGKEKRRRRRKRDREASVFNQPILTPYLLWLRLAVLTAGSSHQFNAMMIQWSQICRFKHPTCRDLRRRKLSAVASCQVQGWTPRVSKTPW